MRETERTENEKKEKELEKKSIENLYVNVFSSTVCDGILQEQKNGYVNEMHQLPGLKKEACS